MKNYNTLSQYILTTFFVVGLIILMGYVPRSWAATEAIPVSSSTGLTAKLILQPTAGDFTATDLKQAAHIISQRLAQANQLESEYEVTTTADYMQLNLSRGKDAPYVAALITRVGHIEFIDGGVTNPPLKQTIQTTTVTDPTAGSYRTLFTSEEVTQFEAPTNGDIFYQLRLKRDAATRLADFHQANPDHYLCMAVDKKVVNCSSMYHWTSQELEIIPNLMSGTNPTMAEVINFAQNGALPMALEIVD